VTLFRWATSNSASSSASSATLALPQRSGASLSRRSGRVVASRARRSRLIAGLDIGTTKVCAIIGQVDESGNLRILGLGSAPSRGMRRGVVTNINQTVEALAKAYGQAFELARVRPREVHVGIAGDHISGINLDGMVEVANPTRASKGIKYLELDGVRLASALIPAAALAGKSIVHVKAVMGA